jgi:hypothetical protein
MKNLALCIILIFFCSAIAQGQGVPVEDLGTISGSLQTDVAQYNQDTLIGAPEVDENVLSNTFFNLLFTRGGFTAGVRFEAYVNPLLGIDPRSMRTRSSMSRLATSTSSSVAAWYCAPMKSATSALITRWMDFD